MLPNTNLIFAVAVAERIRKRVAALALPYRSELKIGVHYGIATYPTDGKTVDFLLKVADLRLYQCREQANFPGAERRNYPRFCSGRDQRAPAAAGTPIPGPCPSSTSATAASRCARRRRRSGRAAGRVRSSGG